MADCKPGVGWGGIAVDGLVMGGLDVACIVDRVIMDVVVIVCGEVKGAGVNAPVLVAIEFIVGGVHA